MNIRPRRVEHPAVDKRGEGSGGTEGIVLDLTLRGDGIGTAVYTVDAFVGQDRQQLAVQLDTGSSDTWLASTSCADAECAGTALYNPSSSSATGQSFDLPYLRGRVSGPVVWDILEIGGYTIGNQALAAADQVSNEPLSNGFTGLLGLSFVQHSLISSKLPPGTTDAPDGAPFMSNLFGLPNAPQNASAFFSVSLARPGMDRVPSLFSIGRHPSAIVPNPTAIRYFPLEQGPDGFSFWRTAVYEINVWTEAGPKLIPLPHSIAAPRSSYPVAVFDTGGADIQTTKQIADAVYGAWDISSAEDGKYYVPCNLQMNVTFSFYNSPTMTTFPLHPLDLSYRPPNDPSSPRCVGAIQAAPWLTGAGAGTADIVLGVAFLRNVYFVMAQTPAVAGLPANSRLATPMIGLMSLTDINVALNEFKRVRIDGLPLDNGSPPSGSNDTSDSESHGPSVAVIVLVSIVGFFALCILVFFIRWWLMRREYMAEKRRQTMMSGLTWNHDFDDGASAGGWFRRRRRSADGAVRYRPAFPRVPTDGPTEDDLRMQRYEALKTRGPLGWTMSEWSDQTRVDGDASFLDLDAGKVSEFGYLKRPAVDADDNWIDLGEGQGKVSEFGHLSKEDEGEVAVRKDASVEGYMGQEEDLDAVGTDYRETDAPSLPRQIAAGIGAGGKGIGLGLGYPGTLVPSTPDRPPLGTRLSSAEEPLLAAPDPPSQENTPTRTPPRAALSRPRVVSYGARPAPKRTGTRQATLAPPRDDDRPAILEETLTSPSGTNDAHDGH